VKRSAPRIACLLAIACTVTSCAGAPAGWQRLWPDRWQWHYRGWEWVRGVAGDDLRFDVEAEGGQLRGELLNLGTSAATVIVNGPHDVVELRLDPLERRPIDVELAKGAHSIEVPDGVALGSPRVGRPVGRPRLLVFVLVDTLRADHVDERLTPGIQRFFESGRRWQQATANCSWTLPSVASLFTARPVLELSAPTGDLIGIPEGMVTWPSLLESAGFEGAAVVANFTVHAQNGFAGGFATYLVPEGGGSVEHPDATVAVGEARRWLEAHRGEDTFLYLHLMEPHEPYRSHSDLSVSAPDLGPLARRQRTAGAEEELLLRRLYAEEVTYVDRVLAPFLADLPDNAVVVFTSDHGEALGEHDAWGHGLNLYQEALEVPLMMTGPGVLPGEVEEPVQLLDLGPTVLELMGIGSAEGMVGRSLFAGGSARPLVSTTFGGGPLRWAWREERDKVVLRMAAQPGLGATARSAMREGRPLPAGGFHFDLATDPDETMPQAVPNGLLPVVGRTFVDTAGRLVPGLQLLVFGERGSVENAVEVAGEAEVVQAWGGGPITVRRDGDRLALECEEAYPLCAAAIGVNPPPTWIDVAGARLDPRQLAVPAGDLEPGLHVWWNEHRAVVVGGYEETMDRLRALGYIE
jgi:arylsulfatase A-like enzyme